MTRGGARPRSGPAPTVVRRAEVRLTAEELAYLDSLGEKTPSAAIKKLIHANMVDTSNHAG